MRAAGFVLVGGSSSRMGRDKALLDAADHPLVSAVAGKVTAAVGNVALVGRPERYGHLHLDTIPDLRPDLGPLAGIEAALARDRNELNVIVACDMPGLNVEWLCRLVSAAEHNGALCTIARDATGALHPLCGVYRSACLPTIQNALDARRLRLLDVVQNLHAATLDIEDMIWNVNTPREWDAWQERNASNAV